MSKKENEDIPELMLGQENVDEIVKREKIKRQMKEFRKKYDELFPENKKKVDEEIFKKKYGTVLGGSHAKKLSEN